MTGVTGETVTEPPIAYCEGCDRAWSPEGGRDEPAGYYHRAAMQHTRDTGHTTVAAVTHLTRYRQGGTQ